MRREHLQRLDRERILIEEQARRQKERLEKESADRIADYQAKVVAESADAAVKVAEGAIAGVTALLEAEKAKQAKADAEHDKMLLGLAKAVDRRMELHKREEEARARINQRLDDELRLLQATSEEERRKIQLEIERRDLLEDQADAKKVELLHEEKLKQLKEDMAKAAEKESAARKQGAEAAREAARIQERQLDITKRFESVPGTGGLFGFGAGRVGFSSWTGGSDREIRRARQTAAGPSAEPNPSPALEEATRAAESMAARYRTMVEQLNRLADAMVRSDKEMQSSTTKAVGQVDRRVGDLEAQVRAFRAELANIGRVGVGVN